MTDSSSKPRAVLVPFDRRVYSRSGTLTTLEFSFGKSETPINCKALHWLNHWLIGLPKHQLVKYAHGPSLLNSDI